MAVKKVKKAAAVTPETAKAPAAFKKFFAPKPADAPVNKDFSYILIDHPANGEIIAGLHYAIRIGASDNGSVEISFNGGEWQPCRASAGYWWFDWGYFTPGTYRIAARIRDNAGATIKKSAVVKCEVK